MYFERIRPLLAGVKPAGEKKWVAKCPAHEDTNPSLAIRETDDGKLLVHCFSGCGFNAIVEALGLKPSDFFPDDIKHRKPLVQPFDEAHILRALARDALILSIAAEDIKKGKPMSEKDLDSLTQTYLRLDNAVSMLRNKRWI